MPLHDEIGLALSFHQFSSREARLLPSLEDLAACIRGAGADFSDYLPGLVLHHLLWRINQR